MDKSTLESVITLYHSPESVSYRSAWDFIHGVQEGSILVGSGLGEEDFERISGLWGLNIILVVWLLDEALEHLLIPQEGPDGRTHST